MASLIRQKIREEGEDVGRRWEVNLFKEQALALPSAVSVTARVQCWQDAFLLGGKWEREASLGRCRGSQRGWGGKQADIRGVCER